jgi:hypothetical protein
MSTQLPPISMCAQLLSASASAAQAKAEAMKPPWPMNPFPTGIRPGSATDRVLTELRRIHPQQLERGQLRMRLSLTRGMTTWALRYLEAHGLVQRLPDPRNSSFKRWRAVVPPTVGTE